MTLATLFPALASSTKARRIERKQEAIKTHVLHALVACLEDQPTKELLRLLQTYLKED